MLATDEATSKTIGLLITFVGIGILVGVGLAVLGVRAMRFAGRHDWIDPAWRQLPAVALALTSFAVAFTVATAWLLDRRSRPGTSMR